MIWHLLLAHFVADYPLQPGWMARNKRRPHVLIGHVSIHFLVMLLLAGEARSIVWPYLLVLALAHLLIDIGKETVRHLRPRWVIGPYVVDQLMHYVTIFLTGTWIAQAVGPVRLPFTQEVAILAATYLVATYVWFISERIFAHGDQSYRSEVQSQLWLRMGTRAVMLSMFLWVLPGALPRALPSALLSALGRPGGRAGDLAIAASVATSVPYISGKHRQRALWTDVFVSLVMAIFAGIALWR